MIRRFYNITMILTVAIMLLGLTDMVCLWSLLQ